MYTTVSHRIKSYQDLVKYKKESTHRLQFSVYRSIDIIPGPKQKGREGKTICQLRFPLFSPSLP